MKLSASDDTFGYDHINVEIYPNKRPLTLRAILGALHIPGALQWCALLATSCAFIVPLELMHIPAALLLGAMAAAILIAILEGALAVPHWPYVLAQGLIGCLVARSIGPAILATMIRQWSLFLAVVFSVLLISSSLGALLARWKVLPGTTAVWGSAPGAAPVMVLMSEGFGGDPRLVAYMQFLRVMMVAFVASIVARLWVGHGGGRVATDWFPAIAAGPLWETIALAWLLHVTVGTDPLSAYLATSPGGADSVAVIAVSSPVDVPFVMAMQIARFVVVLLVGPVLARGVARWTGG